MNRSSRPAVLVMGLLMAVGLFATIWGGFVPQPVRAKAALDPVVEQMPLGPLLDKQVRIVARGATGEFEQHGTLETSDDRFLRFRTKEGKVRCYAIANIIFIEPVASP
jgi:hypothetical protein